MRATMYCLTCKQFLHVPELHQKGHKTKKVPGLKALEHWSFDGVCETPDGCRTEPDGSCPHGYSSWLMLAGII